MRFLYSLIWWLILPLALGPALYKKPERAGLPPSYSGTSGFFSASRFIKTEDLGTRRLGRRNTAAEPLVQALLSRYQDCDILLTHMTPTGRATGRSLFETEKRLVQAYLPYDTNWMMSRLIRHFQPSLCILLETEIWPNLISPMRQTPCSACTRQRTPVGAITEKRQKT